VETVMTQRRRVLLLIPHLGGGGAERVTSLLAQNLSREKYELHLGLIAQTEPATEVLPLRITVHSLGASRVRFAAIPLLRLIRRLRPDVILSGMMHLNSLVLLLRPFLPRKTAVLVRQNSTLSAALAYDNRPRIKRLLYRYCYRKADRVICQSSAMAADLIAELGLPSRLLSVLPNPVEVETLRAANADKPSKWTGPGPHLLAVGRLAHEKGYDLLLSALAIVRLRFPQTDLIVAGSGPEEAALRAACYKRGLESAVRFAGFVNHPHEYFPGSSVFVLSSRHEGLPNALLEAAAGGLPIVALPSSGGVKDLLEGQPGVWLAPEISSNALSVTLLAALEALQPHQRFAHAFVEQFSIDRAILAYEKLLDSDFIERGR
jgi:glycosyltransferase involved in cell wall biosynthesis